MRKKKILFILNLPPPVYGANVIGNYIYRSALINNTFDCEFINLTTAKDVDEIGKGGLKKLILCFKVYYNVLLSILKQKHDLCYLTINSKGNAFYKDFIVVIILKLFRRKIVYHYHNKGVKDGQDNWFLNACYRFQFHNSQAILLTSLLYPDIEKYLPRTSVHICANGIKTIEGLDMNELIKKRDLKKIPQILFLSNMMIEKGVFTVLEASKLLYDKGITFETYFIGAPSDIKLEDFNEYVVSNKLQHTVFYVGKKFGKEKISYLEQADIFVFPTFYHNETFGLVNLEAMQYGLPVISTEEGAIPEIVEDGVTGFIISKKNAFELSSKIEFLIKNPKIRKEMGTNGQKKFKSLFTLEKFEENFVQTIQNVIQVNSGPV